MQRNLTVDCAGTSEEYQKTLNQENSRADGGTKLPSQIPSPSPSGCGCRDGKYPVCNTAEKTSCCPPHGAKAICGRRSKMEDMFVIRPDFITAAGLGDLQTVLPKHLDSGHIRQLSTPVEAVALGDAEESCSSDVMSAPSWSSPCPDCDDALHLFAVYDGHGGVEAAQHCSERMHCNILKAWDDVHNSKSDQEVGADEGSQNMEKQEGPHRKTVQRKTSDHVASVLHESFVTTDTEFIQDDQSALVGSTAVVSLVGQRHICVGYCGDSRAVLCRGGHALPLTVDHKPERDDETERVQDAGGQVLFFNGARVMGLLAMSRAIGDRSLRPFVIPDPEVTIVPRLPDDQLLILASDGLWDVVSNQEACNLAMRCMQKAHDKGACNTNAARLTATVLTRAAMDRGSRDNITVVVVDLRPPSEPCGKSPDRAVATGGPGRPPAVAGPRPDNAKRDGLDGQKELENGSTPRQEPKSDREGHVDDYHSEVSSFDQRQGHVPVQVPVQP